MRIETVSKILTPVLNKLPLPESTKEKAIEIAHKIGDFIDSNRSKVFFAATVLFCIAATANPLAGMAVGEIVVSGILTAAALQGLAVLFGSKAFTEKESQNKIDVILGIINLGSWYLNPAAGVAAAVFNTGAQACSLAFSKLFEIKNPSSNELYYDFTGEL